MRQSQPPVATTNTSPSTTTTTTSTPPLPPSITASAPTTTIPLQTQPTQQYQHHQQQRRSQPVAPSVSQQSQQQPKQPLASQQPIQGSQQQQQPAVTFADHIKVRSEDVSQYTFGFFDDQPTPSQQTKLITTNHNSHANNSRKQPSQFLQSEHKQKPKQVKASPNSEENCYKTKDNFDVNSFNYEQILKYISNGKSILNSSSNTL